VAIWDATPLLTSFMHHSNYLAYNYQWALLPLGTVMRGGR